MSQEEIYINGELLRLRRETRGWALSDLATRACMSVKQIRQLEEGGLNSFYSQAVKLTAAKKVGALLGVSAEEVFAQEAEVEVVPEVAASVELAHTEEPAVEDKAVVEVDAAVAPAEEKAVDSSPTHVEHVESSNSKVEVTEPTKPKTSLWVIAGLFVAALAVAAYMQPKEDPVTEPAPPLQVIPSEADAAASAAEASASSASAAASAESVAPVVQKTASASVASASASVSSASVPRTTSPLPSASAVKTVTVPSAATTASTASAAKAP
jgi:transcriptional regulator with XRE-family HTH domain